MGKVYQMNQMNHSGLQVRLVCWFKKFQIEIQTSDFLVAVFSNSLGDSAINAEDAKKQKSNWKLVRS